MVWWAALLGAALQGFWVVTSVYLVIVAELSAAQLLLLGTALEVTVLVSEVPTGVVADTISRKWSMVISMVVMAIAFIVAGTTTSFGGLVVVNVVWGVGWTFTSGADIAWLADELGHRGVDQPAVDQAITRKARWQQRGGAAGLVGFGLLGWLTTAAGAMMSAGMLLLGLAIWIATRFTEHGLRFTERGFSPARGERLAHSAHVLRTGLALVRTDRAVVRLLMITLVFNLGAEAMDRLTEARLIDLGLPLGLSPVLFFTLLGITGLLGGAVLLRRVEPVMGQTDGPRRLYAAMALVAAVGAVLVAVAPVAAVGAFGVFLSRGLAWSVLPVAGSVWINRMTDGDVRATVQSFLGQATSAGQIAGGLLLGLITVLFDLSVAIGAAAGLFLVSGVLIIGRPGARSRAEIR